MKINKYNFCVGDLDSNTGFYSVMFSAGEVKASFNITIVDDIILEMIKGLNLVLSSISSSRIFAGNIQQVTVFIIDNDGKC